MRYFTLILSICLMTLCLGDAAYAKNDKEKKVPPGLQKKVERGGELPPGWQKKLKRGEKIEPEVIEHGEVIETSSDGHVTVKVDDRIIKVIKNTREIVDIIEGK